MIYFVTSNKGKFTEAQGIFSDLMQKDIGYTEIQRTLWKRSQLTESRRSWNGFAPR